jgi:predicted transcriptional regulator
MKESLTVTMPEELIKRTKALAKKEDRSVSAMVTVLVREGLAKKEEPKLLAQD